MGESACVMQPVPVIPTEAIEVFVSKPDERVARVLEDGLLSSFVKGESSSSQGDPLQGFNDSISFGRFAPESLSWEKWSTFSHKKYVEEAERYSKPGSVAEKKAFFEAHYKKMASMKASALLEQANNAGLDAVTVPSKFQDTGNGELKDHAQKDSTLSDGGLNLESKKEENDTRKEGGGGSFAPENVTLNELGRNPRKPKQDVQMETPPSKDLAGSLTSSSLDSPLQKKRTSFVKFMCGSRSRQKTKERVQKRKEDKAERKRRSWSSCFCIGARQLEDRPKLPTDIIAAVSTTALNGGGNLNIQQQRLESRGL